jgi:hypothetical protein
LTLIFPIKKKCLDLQTNKILMSKHVLFDEHSFPFKDIPKLQTLPSSSSDSTSPLLILRLAGHPITSSDSPSPQSTTSYPPIALPITKVYTRRPPTTPAPSLPLKPSSLSLSTHHMQIRSKTKNVTHKTKAYFATQHPMSLQLDINNLDPTSYSQASKLPHWRNAMALELDTLARNNT